MVGAAHQAAFSWSYLTKSGAGWELEWFLFPQYNTVRSSETFSEPQHVQIWFEESYLLARLILLSRSECHHPAWLHSVYIHRCGQQWVSVLHCWGGCFATIPSRQKYLCPYCFSASISEAQYLFFPRVALEHDGCFSSWWLFLCSAQLFLHHCCQTRAVLCYSLSWGARVLDCGDLLKKKKKKCNK